VSVTRRLKLNAGVAFDALKKRKDDTYQTPPVAIRALLKAERLPHYIWEPACGPGVIARELRSAGHSVFASDLVDYDSLEQDCSRLDFLLGHVKPIDNIGAIVTNPPFKLATQFVERALELAPKVVMLLRLAFLESEGRRHILDSGNLARVHVFRNRLPMMHREGFEGRNLNTSSALAFAWFVWDHHHRGPAVLNRISWEREAQ
jgi:hypothetical protein